MNRRTLMLALAALPALALPALAQGVDVSAIDAYLRALRTAEGRFRQVNPNGSTQAGRFYLAKPGRIRFDYDAPEGAMVIADGINVGVFDPRSNRNPTRYPLSRTPLQLLLREDLSLREPGMVQGATRDERGTHITAVDPRQPQEGRMLMTFAENPVALREWTMTTRAGQRTSVALQEMQTGVALERTLFNIELAAANLQR
ncbi:outer membrane lipoprotein carrier protein LolA [soil metagenome]